MLANFRTLSLPAFRGPVLVDTLGLPRYWAVVWAAFLPADLAPATVSKKLSQLEAFYQHADTQLGLGRLDDALADFDVEVLSTALEGYFLTLRNLPSFTPASEDRWQVALQFITEIAQRVTRNYLQLGSLTVLSGKFERLELLHSKLHIGKRRRPEQIRSLPADVVEFLYELLDPESRTNPFQNEVSRWRVYVLFILMLHQGLRRGELLVLPADAIKSSFDRDLQKERFWMSVRYNEYEDDPRSSKPSIKNAPSIRQLPVSEVVALIVQEYVSNYRGRVGHSFLINSQKSAPMSPEAVSKTFQKITNSLPTSLRKLLLDHTRNDSVTAHAMRHTCAVVRLNQILAEGVEMNDALQRLRAFFGWSRDSEMPLRYARAVFEDRLSSVWRNEFDERVSVLRSLPSRLK
ncbi:site-specific integrase [Granulicella sp. WH15]|uniref:site-specific integrase n=1 Tax=Granulicella sp. WH15 TaxID=2602070 RepID=UPI001366F64E|nr:site-specific integrase [Granulicella sp. WH15]QHN03482.1 site-specific integrase [Granulicella sp. WH15]